MANVAKPTKDYHYSMVDEEHAASFDFDYAEDLLERFFSEEDFSAAQDKDPTKHELLQKLMDGTRLVDTPDGKAYEVPMLWKDEHSKEKLKPNFNLCLAFLCWSVSPLALTQLSHHDRYWTCPGALCSSTSAGVGLPG